MKFVYADETGTGDGSTVIVVGIVLDAYRMHITKRDWKDLLAAFSKMTGRTLSELHFRNFYSGRKEWNGLPGDQRAAGISYILRWLSERKHKLTFSAINKDGFQTCLDHGTDPCRASDLGTAWRAAALHLLLQFQKLHQKEKAPKGQTVVVFDQEDREQMRFIDLFRKPPGWTDSYYGRGRKAEPLDLFVDVPYFVDSEHALLVQAADMVAYLLGRYTKLNDEGEEPKYADEPARIAGWISQIRALVLATPCRYPKTGRCDCADFFWKLCPAALRDF
jgi:hypothetical protein